MASIEKNEIKTVTRTYTLTLSEGEAGQLLDLLRAHVSGTASADGPLNDISKALQEVELKRVYLTNSNPKHECEGRIYYSRPYAVLSKDY